MENQHARLLEDTALLLRCHFFPDCSINSLQPQQRCFCITGMLFITLHRNANYHRRLKAVRLKKKTQDIIFVIVGQSRMLSHRKHYQEKNTYKIPFKPQSKTLFFKFIRKKIKTWHQQYIYLTKDFPNNPIKAGGKLVRHLRKKCTTTEMHEIK